MSNISTFLDLLFDPGEAIWIKRQYEGVCRSQTQTNAIIQLDNWLDLTPSKDGVLVGLNPAADVHLNHQKTSIDAHRTFLIEMDGVDIKTQADIIHESLMPFSAAVFSGGKSIHFTIVLDEPISKVEYTFLAKKIKYALGGKYINHKIEWTVDAKALRPEVSTRIPGFDRGDAFKSKQQKLLSIKGRITLKTLTDWLDSRKKEISKWELLDKLSQPEVEVQPSNAFVDIYVKRHTSKGRGPCPSCRANGRDSTGDHLWVSSSGRVYCNAQCDFKSIVDAIKESK